LFQLLEEEEVEVPVSKEPAKEDAKMDTDEAPSDAAPASSNEADVNMQDAKGTADGSVAENGIPDLGDKPAQMETDVKVSNHAENDFVSAYGVCFMGRAT
jgi:heat shock protein 4